MADRPRFWSDDFDMDLLALWPELPDRLGPTADAPMWTHGGESYGRLNSPSCWNNYSGFDAYFGTVPGETGKPGSYWTSHPIIECTWLEALRDAWPHTYRIVLNGRIPLWNAGGLQRVFMRLLGDVRGYSPLEPHMRDKLRGDVLASIIAATRDLEQQLERQEGAPTRNLLEARFE